MKLSRAVSNVAMARPVSAVFVLLFTLMLVGCDHATKAIAQGELQSHGALALIPGVVDLRYAENRDVAFSAFRHASFAPSSTLLFGLGVVAIAALLAAWWRRRVAASTAEHLAFGLIVAGALGNVIDRAARGFVVDFIHVTHWPIFNVADAAIVAGVALHVGLGLRRARTRPFTG